eukprot:gene15368-23045_t
MFAADPDVGAGGVVATYEHASMPPRGAFAAAAG